MVEVVQVRFQMHPSENIIILSVIGVIGVYPNELNKPNILSIHLNTHNARLGVRDRF